MKILVVDDTASIRDVIEQLLDNAGYEIETADSGEVALEMCRNENYPVIISDIKMKEMSGVDFCRELRKFNPISYTIALTSYRKIFHVAECRSAGFDDYMVKPFEQDELLKRIDMAAHKVKDWMNLNLQK
jgi:DNA-binding response OmpR family regulator